MKSIVTGAARALRGPLQRASCAALLAAQPLWVLAAADLSYLQSLLVNTPEGGWVKASTSTFSSAWASEAEGGVPASVWASYNNPARTVSAWSSMAWDSTRGNLMLFGGGHANYAGNEMYIWQGSNGIWTRGSLPSRLVTTGGQYVVDDAAPQSSHTYDNTVYLPVNDRYLSFGGAAFQSGGLWVTRDGNGNPVYAGPWAFDPSKADPNKVGGTTGSGYLPTSQGGNMWTNRAGQYTGTLGGGSVDGSSAYRNENGKDVVYLTRDSNASQFPPLYRYQAGNYATGELDRWDLVGRGFSAGSAKTSAAIDTVNNLYVRIARRSGRFEGGLGVWDLDLASAESPTWDAFVGLQLNGQPFETDGSFGIAFDESDGRFVLWNGSQRGKVYYVDPSVAADGTVLPTWTVSEATSSTAAQPNGNFETGVLGKWLYISELQAFAALDEYDPATRDAAVWLYKPFAAAVPDIPTTISMVAGLVVVSVVRRRRNASMK